MATLNKTGCCDCGQLITACNCGGPSATTQCRYKSGSAEICGIPEFADPPEHWYRKRTTSGLMTLSKYLDNVCEGLISVGATLDCRSKSGTATMIGIPEHSCGGSPSSPPKYYRRHEATGSINEYNNSGCGNLVRARVYSGALQFDPMTGVPTDARCLSTNGGACSIPTGFNTYVPSANGWAAPANFGEVCGTGLPDTATNTCTRTEGKRTGGNYCCNGGAFGFLRVSGEAYGTLSDDDTEEDAIKRAMAAIGSWTNGTCAASSSLQGARSTTTFTYRFGQTRFVVASGLTSGANYEGRIYVAKRVQGSGAAFVDTGSPIIVNFTASGGSYTSDWQDLPNESGFEFMATGAEVYGEIEAVIRDNWNITEVFAADTCEQVLTDDSARTIDDVPADGPFNQIPPNAYGGHVNVSTSPTLRTTTGKDECNSDGAGAYLQANGTVQEQLENEDTDQDAITRAMNAITDWTEGGCGLPAFITGRTPGNTVFGYRWLNVRAALASLSPTHTYHITWRTYRRANGTSHAYEFYGELIQEVTAVSDTMVSDWVDVPNEAGWDTIVAGTPKVTLVA